MAPNEQSTSCQKNGIPLSGPQISARASTPAQASRPKLDHPEISCRVAYGARVEAFQRLVESMDGKDPARPAFPPPGYCPRAELDVCRPRKSTASITA
ncbi:hypothetical protein DYH09_29880 [bacterium CPR1]|nr:hypothetical protein [bacterium CPR1]